MSNLNANESAFKLLTDQSLKSTEAKEIRDKVGLVDKEVILPTLLINSNASVAAHLLTTIPNNWRPNNPTAGLRIGDGVTSIGSYAFYGWSSNNQPLVIPDSVTSIGSNAFLYWFSNNQPLVIGDSVTGIRSSAFGFWTSNNQPLVIPDSVTIIRSEAFAYWTSNTQPLVIPDSVTSIGSSAFRNWTSNTQPIYIACNFSAFTGTNIFLNKGTTPAIYVLSGKGFTLGVQNFQGLTNVDIRLWTSYPDLMP